MSEEEAITPEPDPIEVEPAVEDIVLTCGPIQVRLTSRCLVCAAETDSYQELRTHCDINDGHFFVSICR